MAAPLLVRTITAAEHRVYIASQPSVALEQTPGWGRGFVTARTESVGWFDGDRMIGAGLYRLRGLPRLPMRSVAVFESGPDIDWTGRRRPGLQLADWLGPLIDHLRDRGVFTARINPAIAARDWWAFDPGDRPQSKELVRHRQLGPMPDARATADRLRDAGWRPWATGPNRFLAEVVLARPAGAAPEAPGAELLPGTTVRTGTVDDLPAVHAALAAAHPQLTLPSLKDLTARWRGLADDDFAGVTLLVLERNGDVSYGGLFAVVGDRAWDLAPPLPAPDADLPTVQLLRSQVLQRTRESGARTLTIPTVVPARHAPVEAPAPGWPPVHLAQLMSTWQLPVRATWHNVLAPVVDRLVL